MPDVRSPPTVAGCWSLDHPPARMPDPSSPNSSPSPLPLPLPRRGTITRPPAQTPCHPERGASRQASDQSKDPPKQERRRDRIVPPENSGDPSTRSPGSLARDDMRVGIATQPLRAQDLSFGETDAASTRRLPNALPEGARHDVSGRRVHAKFAELEGPETSCPARPHEALSSTSHLGRPSDTRGGLSPARSPRVPPVTMLGPEEPPRRGRGVPNIVKDGTPQKRERTARRRRQEGGSP
jgi:hypothetical protein